MESTTHKQLAQSASQKANQVGTKASFAQRELDSLGEDDEGKRAGLKNRILSLQSQSTGYAAQAADHRSDAVRSELKESKEAFDKIEEEQEEVRKQEAKNQQKLEAEAEKKANLKSEKNGIAPELKEDFGEELFALGDNVDTSYAHVVEDIVDFSVANPTTATNDDLAKTKKPEEEEIKAINGSSATNK